MRGQGWLIFLPLGHRVVYALVDPRDGVVRYIGVTNNPEHRLKEHLGSTKKATQKVAAWLQDLKNENKIPVFVFLDSIKAEEALKKEMIWINHFENLSPLYNHKKR